MSSAGMPDAVHRELRRARNQLFALVDAAQGAPVYHALSRLPVEQRASLYQEPHGTQELAYAAPHLVHVDDAALPALAEWWGKHCVVYVASTLELAKLRKHFRKFLMVRGWGKTLYFRFYDPRILPTFLLNATAPELEAFGEGIDKFLVECDGGSAAWLFEQERNALRHRELRDEAAQSGAAASRSSWLRARPLHNS